MSGHLASDDIFLTTEEVLEYLQVNLRTVYRLIKAGKIPAVRVGRQWRFRKRDIDAWLDTQRPRGERAGAAAVERDAARTAAASVGLETCFIVAIPGIAPIWSDRFVMHPEWLIFGQP